MTPTAAPAGVVAALRAATVLAAMAEAALTFVARDSLAHGDLASQLALAVSIVAYATLGALIIRQTGNLIGWIMLGAGAAQAFLTIASIYAVIGIATCAPPADGWWKRRMPNGARSNGTCTTGRSSSSSPSRFTWPCSRNPPMIPPRPKGAWRTLSSTWRTSRRWASPRC